MEHWLEWARGPAFRFALALMLLGIARVVVLSAINIAALHKTAQDKNIPARAVVRETLRWLLPFNREPRPPLAFALTSFAFHASVIIVPIFLAAHILLWERGLGIRWPAIPQSWADNLTLVAIVTSVVLFARRVSSRITRSLNRFQDYFLPILIGAAFASGYLAMHPAINPFEYDPTLFVHVMSGNLLLVLVPFSKLSHMFLYPATQLVSDLGWHLAPESGTRVALALAKESEPI